MNETGTAYNRGVVRPMKCLQEGYQLVKRDYWLILGIIIVGLLVGSALPMGILMGPLMCGIYLCLLRRWDGRRLEFSDLFKGFDYFLPALIATLIMLIPALLLGIPFAVGIFATLFAFMPSNPG